MNNPIELEALTDYLCGESTPAEAERVLRWIEADPRHAAEAERLRCALVLIAEPEAAADTKAAWRNVKLGMAAQADTDGSAVQIPAAAIRRHGASQERRSAPIYQVRHAGTVRRSAGILAGSIAAGLTLIFGWQAMTMPRRAVAAPLASYATARGERANIMLADGTRITLGVMSTVRFDSSSTTGPRHVSLDGEAYFDVEHNPARPFTVHIKNTTTQVLGTAFAVRGYATDSAVQVAVASGKVAFDDVVLAAGDVGVHTGRGVAMTHNADIALLTAWREGQIVFDKVPLSYALSELSRWYDLKFVVADSSLANRVITATFIDRTAADVADGIAVALYAQYKRQGNTITFWSRSTTQ